MLKLVRTIAFAEGWSTPALFAFGTFLNTAFLRQFADRPLHAA